MKLYGEVLLRFDDICPTMNWSTWDAIEPTLRALGATPLVAVVPDNTHEALIIDEPRPDFWNRVRLWQSWGWSIAIHGQHHSYRSADRGLVGRIRASEFAGRSYAEQKQAIEAGLAIFREHGVSVDAWVAPASSFDSTTLAALGDVGVHVVSDGFGLRPWRDEQGIIWVPQQVGRLLRTIPPGVWTVALHHNNWTDRDIDTFLTRIHELRGTHIGLAAILTRHSERTRTPLNRCMAAGWLAIARGRAGWIARRTGDQPFTRLSQTKCQ